MPTILRVGPYRFSFYAGDQDEPEHIHVSRDNLVAKFWLDPVRLGNYIPVYTETLDAAICTVSVLP